MFSYVTWHCIPFRSKELELTEKSITAFLIILVIAENSHYYILILLNSQ